MTLSCECKFCHVAAGKPEECPNAAEFAAEVPDGYPAYRQEGFTRDVCRAHSQLLGRGSSQWPRVEHLREYCLHAGVGFVGLAICSAFLEEARTVRAYLREKNIDAVIACCKIGAVRLADIGVDRDIGYDYALCNPVGQAMLLNRNKTQMNVLMGLCLPHDMLVIEHADAPCTTLFVKENMSGHHPLGTLRDMKR